jgi:hypothetical protein
MARGYGKSTNGLGRGVSSGKMVPCLRPNNYLKIFPSLSRVSVKICWPCCLELPILYGQKPEAILYQVVVCVSNPSPWGLLYNEILSTQSQTFVIFIAMVLKCKKIKSN